MIRAGLGFDAHPFDAQGRPLRLGGLDWPGQRGLAGHSDGDVLLHAIADAVLGAARLGSLGERFPDTDSTNRGRDSAQMLEMIGELVLPRFAVISLDATVVGEAPRVAPRRVELEARIAQLLSIEVDRVSVKGTSSNGLGFPGRAEGLAAMAVVLLESRRSPGEGG